VYAVGSTLFAFTFDVKKLRPTGGPAPLLEGVRRSTATGAAQFSISSNGELVYITSERLTGNRTLAVVDRATTRNSIQLPPGLYNHPRVAPDGKQLAVAVGGPISPDIWIYDLTGAVSPRRLTFGGNNQYPVWTRDGQRIVFFSNRGGDSGLFWQRADGNGPAEKLVKTEPGRSLVPYSWSPDGGLTYGVDPASRRATIWAVSPGSGQPPKMLIDIPGGSATNSSFSPDGHWIAYGSTDERGQAQVYVQPFPVTRTRYQISSSGDNHYPLWSPKGGQLFFIDSQQDGTGQIVSVDIKTEPHFTMGKTMPLPIKQIYLLAGPRSYDITPDDKYFVVILSQADLAKAPPEQINVTLNWFEELKQRVPAQ